MKTLLLPYLGNAAYRRDWIARLSPVLRELGLRTVIADDVLSPGDAERFDEVLELPPPEQVEATVRVLERFAAAHPLDAVLAQTEAALPAASILIERLSLPGIPVEAALSCVSKHLSRCVLQAGDVPVPRFALVEDAQAVRRFFDEVGGPIVIKAVSSTMARLVQRLDRTDEIAAAVKRMQAGLAVSLDVQRLEQFVRASRRELGCDPRKQFLVETFVAGDAVETDGLVLGSEPASFGVTEEIMRGFYIEGYLTPADRPAAELAGIEAISNAAIEASGLRDAGYSIEMRGTGPDVRVIEVNGRFGEDDGFSRLFRAADGRKSFPRAIELALGLPSPIRAMPSKRRAVAYQSFYDEAVVERVPTANELDALRARGFECGLCAAVGENMHAPPHPDVFPHLAWAYAEDAHSSRAAFERAREAVHTLRFELRTT